MGGPRLRALPRNQLTPGAEQHNRVRRVQPKLADQHPRACRVVPCACRSRVLGRGSEKKSRKPTPRRVSRTHCVSAQDISSATATAVRPALLRKTSSEKTSSGHAPVGVPAGRRLATSTKIETPAGIVFFLLRKILFDQPNAFTLRYV